MQLQSDRAEIPVLAGGSVVALVCSSRHGKTSCRALYSRAYGDPRDSRTTASQIFTKADRGSQDSLSTLCRSGLRTVYILFYSEEDVLMAFNVFFLAMGFAVRLAPCSEQKETTRVHAHDSVLHCSIKALANAIRSRTPC